MISEIKLFVVAGSLAVFFAWFGWYTFHERDEGADKVKAAVAVAVQKDNAIVAAGTSTAQASEYQSAILYKQAVAIPAVGDVDSLVCQRAAASVPLPAAGSVASAGTGNATAHSGSGSTFDPEPAILDRAHVADAQIAYLQRRIAELKKQMNDAP